MVLLAVLCGGLGRVAAAGAGTPATIRLPKPSADVILRWDSLGGLRAAADLGGAALLLHADGRYSAPAATPGGPRRTGRLSADALHDLLVQVLVQQQFGAIDASDIEARLKQAAQVEGRLLLVMDGGVTRIEVRLPEVQHTVKLGRLHAAYQAFPDIEPLQRLYAIQQLLLKVADTAR